MEQAKNVAILIFDNVEVLDFCGPFEVFTVSSNKGKDFIVPGGMGTRKEMYNQNLLDWINSISYEAELILSVCTGTLILAKANLLEGLRITTHHMSFELLREVAPQSSELVEGVRYIDNGKIVYRQVFLLE